MKVGDDFKFRFVTNLTPIFDKESPKFVSPLGVFDKESPSTLQSGTGIVPVQNFTGNLGTGRVPQHMVQGRCLYRTWDCSTDWDRERWNKAVNWKRSYIHAGGARPCSRNRLLLDRFIHQQACPRLGQVVQPRGVGGRLKRTKKTRPGPDGPDASRWYGRLRLQKLTLSVFTDVKSPGQSLHYKHFIDELAPSPW